MEAARKFIQTVRFVLAGAVVMYALVVWRLPSSATPKLILLQALTVVAVSIVVIIFVLRKIQVFPVESTLAKDPQDAKALLRWRQGYIVTYCLSLSIALYGLLLHFLGFSILQITPFFIAGLVLILFLGPKEIPENPFPVQSSGQTPR